MADSITTAHIPASLLETLPELPIDLFPLPLTAFEKYLIWDETPQQPMNSFIELHFMDPLQVNVMEEAIAAAMFIHPMFVCTVTEKDGELVWQHQKDFRHRLRSPLQQAALSNGRPVAINLFHEPGIRFWYSEDQNKRSRVLIQLHHASADGVGLRRFLIDAMTLYAHATSPERVDLNLRPPWNKVDLSLLKRRADFSDTFGGPPAKPLTTWQRLKNARYFHFQLPKPLKGGLRQSLKNADNVDSVDRAVRYGSLSRSAESAELDEPLEHLIIDRETSSAILEKSRTTEVGINELALALLFESSSLWNQQHGDRNPKSRLRVLMPYDLRSRIDLRMPAANRLSFAFLGRLQSDCNRLPELIASIGNEIQSIKDSQLPLDFLAALEGAAKHPRIMRWAIGRSRNMATAVLTYAGDISRGMQKYFPEQDGTRIVGDARLDKILAAPPTRDNTHVSLGLCVNWGQLCISAAFNREGFSREQCQEFLQFYYSRWLLWLKCAE
jgi:hypothetical protein